LVRYKARIVGSPFLDSEEAKGEMKAKFHGFEAGEPPLAPASLH
jgi:hypothetical protein